MLYDESLNNLVIGNQQLRREVIIFYMSLKVQRLSRNGVGLSKPKQKPSYLFKMKI